MFKEFILSQHSVFISLRYEPIARGPSGLQLVCPRCVSCWLTVRLSSSLVVLSHLCSDCSNPCFRSVPAAIYLLSLCSSEYFGLFTWQEVDREDPTENLQLRHTWCSTRFKENVFMFLFKHLPQKREKLIFLAFVSQLVHLEEEHQRVSSPAGPAPCAGSLPWALPSMISLCSSAAPPSWVLWDSTISTPVLRVAEEDTSRMNQWMESLKIIKIQQPELRGRSWNTSKLTSGDGWGTVSWKPDEIY